MTTGDGITVAAVVWGLVQVAGMWLSFRKHGQRILERLERLEELLGE